MSEGKIGQVIGSYKLLSVLGEGGMGVVYKAEHTMLGRKVALKMLLAEYSEQSDIVGRFFAEAKSVNKIGHKNIIDIVDYGTAPDNCPFFIMELLQGEELAKLLTRVGSLEVDRAVSIVKQIASALEACHAAGILHRDLKPENVFIVPANGRQPESVKVLDFGVAKLIRPKGDITLPNVTQPGVVFGTPQYMAPEQARGEEVDEQADVYTLGLVFYEMLVGAPPFTGKNVPDLMVKMLTSPLPIPSVKNPLIPKPIEEVLLKALERRKESRFASMTSFILALDRAHALVAEQSASPTLSPAAGFRAVSSFSPEVKRPSPKESTPKAPPKTETLRYQLSYGAAIFVSILVFSVGAFLLAQSFFTPEESEEETTEQSLVALAFSSPVEGVTLYEGKNKLGVLPYAFQAPTSPESRVFTFQKEGYAPKTQTITPSNDQQLSVVLDKLPEKTNEASTSPQSKSVAQGLLKPIETLIEEKPKQERPKPKPQAPPEQKQAVEIMTPTSTDPTPIAPILPDPQLPVLKNPNVTVKPCAFDPSQPICQKN